MKQGKELAIAVAEKLGKQELNDLNYWIEYEADTPTNRPIQDYLKQKAADVLFQKGMANRICNEIGEQLRDRFENEGRDIRIVNFPSYVEDWWRTVTPEKILNVFLELE